jgi:hypothetical protein
MKRQQRQAQYTGENIVIIHEKAFGQNRYLDWGDR